MTTIIDLKEFRERFVTYVSYLYVRNNISFSNISDKIVYSETFRFLDDNNVSSFLQMPYEDFVYVLFNDHAKYYESKIPVELLWALDQYITVGLNLFIPIRRLFLLCPISEMIELFPVYHEMNEIQLVDYFKNKIINRNIFKSLKKKVNITYHELSVLTGINLITLKNFDKDNNFLYNTSFSNINALQKLLQIDSSILNKESNLLIIDRHVLENSMVKNNMINFLNNYYKSEVVIINYQPIFQIKVNNKTIYPADYIFEQAYRYATKTYLENSNNLLF